MSSLQFNLFNLFFTQVVLTVLQHTSIDATVVSDCINSTSLTNSCSDITFEQVYNSFAKSENSFNIKSALYPAKKLSSVRVFVNVFGPNKTYSFAKYTWSTHCLYAELPAKVIEVWSLWSFMVTRRTQELNITIPLSGCTSGASRGKLKEHIVRILAALKELAVSSSKRKPQLNSAECVTEGHKPDIEYTRQSRPLIAYTSLFAVLCGPLLAFAVLDYQRNSSLIVNRTIDSLCGGLLVIFILLFTCKEFTIVYDENVPLFIHAIYPGIAVVGLLVGLFARQLHPSIERKHVFYIICANLTCFHFSWLTAGGIINTYPIHLFGCLIFLGQIIVSDTTGEYNDPVLRILNSVFDINDIGKHCLVALIAVFVAFYLQQ